MAKKSYNKKQKYKKKTVAKQPSKSMKKKEVQPSKFKKFRVYPLLILGLTLLVYTSSLQHDFIYNWDDSGYIIDNEVIHELSSENIKTIFSSFYFHNYHPITTISYAIEYALVGESPFLYHLNNLIFHLLNTLLVFWLILLIKPKKYDWAAIVAFLFALHPMHVESVAWISERKDVLYAFFFLASLISYLYYKTKDKKIRYLVYSFIFFLLSCLSKSMAVTLPLVLILIDFYLDKESLNFKIFLHKLWKFGIGKIHFFAVSLLFGILAIKSQDTAIQDLNPLLTIYERISVLAYTFMLYFLKVFAPIKLSAMYPYPLKTAGVLPLEYLLAPIAIVIIAVLLIIYRKKLKELFFGLLFFLITIAVVIQFVPVGGVILSERYTYLPYLGFFFMIGAFYQRIRFDKKFVLYPFRKSFSILLLMMMAWFTYLSYDRISYWENGDVLFTDVIEKYPNFPFAYSNRGYLYFDHYAMKTNKETNPQQFVRYMDLALSDYNSAISLDTSFVSPRVNKAVLLYNYGQFQNDTAKYFAALKDFTISLKLQPKNKDALLGRANTLGTLKRYEEAIPDYNAYIQLMENPNRKKGDWDAKAYLWRGTAYYKTAKIDKALSDFQKTANLIPEYWESYYWMALIYQQKEDYKTAISYYNQALQRNPEHSESYSWRGLAKYKIQDYQGAINDYTLAIQYNPNDVAAYINRALAYNDVGMYKEALNDLNILLQSSYPVNQAFYFSVKEKAQKN